jgi:cell pole-organizing protein PopZ
MTQAAKSQEPSMEEILASIRRIIADDDATKSAQRPPEPPKPAPAAAAPAARPAPPPRAPAPPEPSPMEAAAAAEAVEPEPAPEMPVDEQGADILDLTESMAMPQPVPSPAPQFRTIDGSFDVSYEEPAEKLALPPAATEPPAYAAEERSRLMSNVASAAVDSAFNTLAQTVLVQNARTLEDLVREMLRPMLKSWLDDNLPSMVERLVRNEIERVSRGRMG